MRKCLYPPCQEDLERGQIGPYCCNEHRWLDAQKHTPQLDRPFVDYTKRPRAPVDYDDH